MSDHDADDETKTIEGFLVVDWDDGSARWRKTEPSPTKRGRTEIHVPVSVDVRVPTVDVPAIEGDITVPAPDVEAAMQPETDEEVEN